jgi:hypothetical protein
MHTGILDGKPEGKRQPRRRRPTWEDDIKMDFKELLWDGVDWIDLAQDRVSWWGVVNAVTKLLSFLKMRGIFLTT